MEALWRAIKALGPIDLRTITRDGLFLTLIILPPALALVFRFGLPPLAGALQAASGVDLPPYYPLLMGALLVTPPIVAGVLIGFLVLDERDDRVLSALAVTPLPFGAYLAYRLLMPMALGFVMILIAYPLAGLVPLAAPVLIGSALIAMLTAPVTALILASFAANKVAGLAVQKLLSGVQNLPIIAFFVPLPWQLALGVIPTYWPMKMVWQGAAGAPVWPYALAGLAVHGLALAWLIRRFNTVRTALTG